MLDKKHISQILLLYIYIYLCVYIYNIYIYNIQVSLDTWMLPMQIGDAVGTKKHVSQTAGGMNFSVFSQRLPVGMMNIQADHLGIE